MKNIIQTEKAPKAIGPYSQAVANDSLVFTSGQLGINMQTGKLALTVEEQAKYAMENLGAILQAQNLSYSDIVKTTVFLTNMSDFSAVNAIYQSYFTGDYPARSCIQVGALPLGGLVEIECIACR